MFNLKNQYMDTAPERGQFDRCLFVRIFKVFSLFVKQRMH